jgi:hypothetical protein
MSVFDIGKKQPTEIKNTQPDLEQANNLRNNNESVSIEQVIEKFENDF